MKSYQPRRAGKQWLEGAPAYILDCFADRGNYTVFFTGDYLIRRGTVPYIYANTWVPYLGMDGAPTHPQGVSMWGELSAYDTAGYRRRAGRQRVKWADLPANIQNHIIARCTQS